ncbi:TetR family transcriptional regulator [Corynebacterium antarcticum]|uniref:TetR family transcriptional regulator n=1 Tax=Corynebacterium antarcticum TaxID=2800405 RepID=UPI0020036E90|nr:TetR family transcriptional regulator [Corynebacterium antarcticum]MCK7642648.1 TetR family transcriptional regulator [Corynebacterium antarcticum]MCK7660664.1 TetR family transcriptional regulator [Corynebacterium antarcticum]MCX7539980.1 TetR family transcriptional regulator [Corynebacterium antarcticum]
MNPVPRVRPLTPEQLLIIADEVTAVHRVRVRDHALLAGAAAVTSASYLGIPVHRDIRSAAAALSEAIIRLAPLDGANDVLADAAAEILRRINAR